MTNVIVDTRKYKSVHGKNPKGYGRWAFSINGDTHFFSGTFTNAKKQAVSIAKDMANAKESGSIFIDVLS